MEDDGGVKAPVTRLRRRLSVEQSDDTRSSPAPNTPTKKRGRRAVKPELELIDENAPEGNTPKRTTKKVTAMKELETEEKPVTPSRRSARIKSNTSLILETTQTDHPSPRAQRATRRNSQVGSDNEAPLTPARVTRRTRRDSANIDKAEPQAANNIVAPVTDIIIEEPETTSRKSQGNAEEPLDQSQSPSGLRKSPRLSLKNNRNGSIVSNESDKNKTEKLNNRNNNRNSTEYNEKEDEHNNSNKENEALQDEDTNKNGLPVTQFTQINVENISNDTEIKRLSISNVELLNKLNNEPRKKSKNLNKSSSALPNTETQSFVHKRHRTKSWGGLSDTVQNDNKFFSDSESAKKPKPILLDPSGQRIKKNVSNDVKNTCNSSASEKINSVQDASVHQEEKNLRGSPSKDRKLLSPKENSINMKIFDKYPTNDLQALVYIEESDSNSEKMYITQQVEEKCQEISSNKEKRISTFNQVKVESSALNRNDSCEPMDIDETLPDNISNKSALKALEISENKVSSKVDGNSDNEKSRSRKSSLILNTSQTLDKTANENKSTLVLSQLKDVSNEINVSQSPQNTNEEEANANQVLNITQDNQVAKKNLTSNYLTSTPLQQKGLMKHTIQVNTSGINSNNTSKIDKSHSKLNVSNTNKTSEESESDNSSQEESNFVDDEAEDAGDDYESGDSRDENDKQYEKDHEILEKGETLTSENEFSNDSDYEKDSFVVSSDEEDNELLDGSSDDLSTSDNELKMSAKSKKKYNERKVKEQKKASREMFESRHKLNNSNNSNKSQSTKVKKNRAVLDSSESEQEEIQVKVKKNKKMRLDSSHETSMNKSIDDTSKIELNNTLQKQLNNDDVQNEVEMTFIEHDVKDEIDPLQNETKTEPKTPQKEIENTSVQFIDADRTEKTNKSQLNMTTADDPLEEANMSESSDSSDNEHIQNYDSVLNALNTSFKTKKHKETDISLNTERKPKPKAAPIVDQLNLTQTKLKKKKKTDVTLQNNIESMNESKNSINMSQMDKNSSKKKSVLETAKDSDSETSASIDLNLLFSEESNDSEDVTINKKLNKENDKEDDFIPLKKSQGKTDMLETSSSHNKSNSHSAKKTKKANKTLEKSSIEDNNCGNETEMPFFLDTTGTHNSTAIDKSFNESSTKAKKIQPIAMEDDSDSDAPMEVSNKSLKETQRNEVNVVETMNASLVALNKSKIKTPKSDKKKKRKESLSKEEDNTNKQPTIEDSLDIEINQPDKSMNKSVSKTPKSEKKKSKKLSESQVADKDNMLDSDAPTITANTSLTKEQEEQIDTEDVINSSLAAPNKSITKTPKSDKKKKRTSESQRNENTDSIENEPVVEDISEAKENLSGVANKSVDRSMSKTPRSEKIKAKKISESQSADGTGNHDVEGNHEIEKEDNLAVALDKSTNNSMNKTPKSEKKKKKLSESQTETQISSDINESLSKNLSEDKKATQKTLATDDANSMGNDTENKNVADSKKRKRKSSLSNVEKEAKSEDLEPPTCKPSDSMTSTTTNQSKKRKISHNVEDSDNIDQGFMTKNNDIEKTKIQDMGFQKHQSQSQINNKKDAGVLLDNKIKMKKRKDREEDEENKTVKVMKFNSDEKVQITRLPASILSQLEDKPTKRSHQITKPKAISTTSFVVEENKVRKNKPSSYLEESIYLNEEDEGESKKQKYIKNPKVLPTLPTVSTSNSGYTTDFKVNILPKQIQFVAKSTSVSNYKNDYLENKKIKRLGTYELYKRNRSVKMSKF